MNLKQHQLSKITVSDLFKVIKDGDFDEQTFQFWVNAQTEKTYLEGYRDATASFLETM